MLSRFSVKKPYTVVVAVVLIILLGVVSFMDMTTDLLPSMNLPYAIVMTSYPGASPEEVEMTITKPVEQTMATVSNIKTVSSTSQENASTVILEFDQAANMDSVTIEMRESLDQISGYWPESVANPIIMKLNPDMMPVMVAAVSASGDSKAAVSQMIQKDIVPEIESIEGVASVSAMGTIEEHVNVTIQQSKIEAANRKIQNALKGEFEDAQKELDTAKDQLETGKSQLEAGKQELNSQIAQFAAGEAELLAGEAKLEEGFAQLEAGQTAIDSAKVELALKEAGLGVAYAETLNAAYAQAEQAALEGTEVLTAPLQTQRAALQAQYDALPEEQVKERELLHKQMQVIDAQIEEIRETALSQAKEQAKAAVDQQFEQGKTALADGKRQLEEKEQELTAARNQLATVKLQLGEGKITLAQANAMMDQAKVSATVEMATAQAQLASGEAQLESGQDQLEDTQKSAAEGADLRQMLTSDMVSQILAAQNFTMPAGYVKEAGLDYLIRVGDKFGDIQEIKEMPLLDMGIGGLAPIMLADVADVSYVDNAKDVYAKINGEQGVMLTLQKQTGYSTGDVSKRIADKFEALEKNNQGLHIATLMDQGVYIDLIVNSVLQNILYGGILAVIILLIFLKSFRPTLVIACSIPISIVAAIVLMYFSGITLNIISLSGLALGVGMLVDNSIVVIENIYRMRNEEGASAKTAAIEGARQVSGAIIASTLTTVCVFAPIVFTKGITRQLFIDMGLTIAYSLLASLVVALTVVPMMSAGVLKKTAQKESRFFDRIKGIYGSLLQKALQYKVLVLAASLGLLIVSVMLELTNGTAFMPSMESTQISISIETEQGSSLAETSAAADQVMDKLMEIDSIEDVGAMAAVDTFTGQTANTNKVEVYAIIKEDAKLSNDQIQERIEQDTKGLPCTLTVNMSNMDMSALGSTGIVVQIKGKELDTLQEIATEVAAIVEKVKGTTEVSDGMEETTAELRVVVDKEKAVKRSLTVAQVYQELAAQLASARSGTVLNTDTNEYDVFVVNGRQESLTREQIKMMTINAAKKDGTTEKVPLHEIATFTDAVGLQAINREAQSRYLNVTAEIEKDGNIGIVSNRVQKALAAYQAPEGYVIKMTGEDETIRESMVELFKMLALAIVFMYLIMVAQFQSLRSPFIIMFTLPLAFTGGLLGLFITGAEISVIAMIGFVMLSGIIVNNGIVFVDYTNQLIAAGMEKREALVDAGQTRLRPIVMTALTTILGLSTMAIGVGMGADMIQPMAIVTIGGLIYGTVLTLFVVPCIFDLFHSKEKAGLRDRIEKEEEIRG